MIIQINATVCAAADHGDDRQHKIAGSDQGKRVQEGQERAMTRAKQEFEERVENDGSSGRWQYD